MFHKIIHSAFKSVLILPCFCILGLYCKWHIKGIEGQKLVMDFLDFNIYHNSPECVMDGLVVYLGKEFSSQKLG